MARRNVHGSSSGLLILATGTVVALVGAMIWLWPQLQPGDKGTWAGAAGTVATLFGTIWLATTETRRRERNEMELAKLAACNVRPKVQRVQELLAAFKERIADVRNAGGQPDYSAYIRDLKAAGEWTGEEVAPLTVIDGHLAYRLVLARAQINRNLLELEYLRDRPIPHDVIREIALVGAMGLGFIAVNRFLEHASGVMWNSIQDHSFHLLTEFAPQESAQND